MKTRYGPKAHEPTAAQRGQVEAMASYGETYENIAVMMEMSADSLVKYYPKELKKGRIKANALVAQSLFKKATGDGPQSAASAMFWLKTRAGWRETSNVEITGKDGGALKVSSDDGFAAFAAGLDAIALAKASGALEAQGMAGDGAPKTDCPR